MTLRTLLFAPISPLHAAVFRLALAGTLALVFAPRRGLESLADSAAYWAATAIAWGLFCGGVAPRAAGVVLAALLFPLSSEPGLGVSRQILLFTLLAFSMVPSGARLGLRRPPEHPAHAGPAWPIRLIQLQLSAVYGLNALAKTTPSFLSGETLVALSLLPNFRVDLSDGYLHVGPFALAASLVAVAVVLAEYVLAIGFWVARLRPALAVFGVAFHLALNQAVEIGMLDVASVFLYVAFLLPFGEARHVTSDQRAAEGSVFD